MDWIWMLRWAVKANKRSPEWSLKEKKKETQQMFLSLSQYSSMHLDETAKEMKQMTRKISPWFYQDARGHYEEESNHSSTWQSQNCTGSNGITAYTKHGFYHTWLTKKKKALLFYWGERRAQPDSTRNHFHSLLHTEGFTVLFLSVSAERNSVNAVTFWNTVLEASSD